MPLNNVLICLVIGIADGDSLTARCETPAGMENFSVRLAEIDAPEKAQPFGNRSKQHLAGLCFKKPALLAPQSTDRYGRTVGRVACDGVDASDEQLQAGMAWVFDRYVTDRGLYAVQDEAKAARVGLWVDADPVPPWTWRKERRDGTAPE
jgi:endonuclease YncB( thermonuclease family)